MTTNKIISVKGLASMGVTPDTIRINVTMKRSHPTYEEAYVQGLSCLQSLSDILPQNGLESADCKLREFSITKPLLNPNGKCSAGVRCYELDQLITVDLASDEAKVRDIIKGIGAYIPTADTTLEYLITSPLKNGIN